MKTIVSLVSLVSLLQCQQDSLKSITEDVKGGIHFSNIDYASIYVSYAFYDIERYLPNDKGAAAFISIGISTFKCGIEYVDRSHGWAQIHGVGSNTSIGLSYLRVYNQITRKDRIGNYFGLEIGYKLVILKWRVGYYRNMVPISTKRDLVYLETGWLY